MRQAVLVAAVTAHLAGAAGAQPMFEEGPGPDGEDVREALAREIARIEADIAAIEGFKLWQAALTRIARTDPAEALRQRLPMSECRASVLAPLCDELTGLFRPEEGEKESPAPPGIGEEAP